MPIGVGRRVEPVRAADAVGVVERIGRKGRAVAAEGVAGGIGVVGVSAPFAAIVPLLVIEARSVGGEGIGGRLVAEGAAIGAEGIVHPVRREGAAGAVGVGGGLEGIGIGAEVAEVFGLRRDGERRPPPAEAKQPAPEQTLRDRHGILLYGLLAEFEFGGLHGVGEATMAA